MKKLLYYTAVGLCAATLLCGCAGKPAQNNSDTKDSVENTVSHVESNEYYLDAIDKAYLNRKRPARQPKYDLSELVYSYTSYHFPEKFIEFEYPAKLFTRIFPLKNNNGCSFTTDDEHIELTVYTVPVEDNQSLAEKAHSLMEEDLAHMPQPVKTNFEQNGDHFSCYWIERPIAKDFTAVDFSIMVFGKEFENVNVRAKYIFPNDCRQILDSMLLITPRNVYGFMKNVSYPYFPSSMLHFMQRVYFDTPRGKIAQKILSLTDYEDQSPTYYRDFLGCVRVVNGKGYSIEDNFGYSSDDQEVITPTSEYTPIYVANLPRKAKPFYKSSTAQNGLYIEELTIDGTLKSYIDAKTGKEVNRNYEGNDVECVAIMREGKILQKLYFIDADLNNWPLIMIEDINEQ